MGCVVLLVVVRSAYSILETVSREIAIIVYTPALLVPPARLILVLEIVKTTPRDRDVSNNLAVESLNE